MDTLEFTFNAHELRTVEIDGAPWFVAVDACRIIGLKASSAGAYTRHLERLSGDERRVMFLRTPTPSEGRGYSGRNTTIVSESGLYKLIMRSDKPAAREVAHADERRRMPLDAPDVTQDSRSQSQLVRTMG